MCVLIVSLISTCINSVTTCSVCASHVSNCVTGVIMHYYVAMYDAVNYRGSMGYGQDSIFSLPGKVGSQDVQDVQVRGNKV